MKFKGFVGFLFLFFIFCFNLNLAFATSVGSGSYRDDLPSGAFTGHVYKTTDLIKKLTSNDWWSSLLFSQYSYNMYVFPLCYKADTNGLIIGTPDYVVATSTGVTADFQSHVKIQALAGETLSEVAFSSTNISGFSDWAVNAKWEITSDASKYFTATMGQGFLFTYFTFAGAIKPEIVLPIEWGNGGFYVYNNDNLIGVPDTTHAVYGSVKKIITDNFAIDVKMDTNGSSSSWEDHYYGVFLPEGTTVYLANYNIGGEYGYHRVIIELPSDKKYMSVGLMKTLSNFPTWKECAYTFVTDTKVSWSVDETNSQLTNTYTITTDDIRTATADDGGDTIMALFPHQYKNGSGISYMTQTFPTIRGTMKLTQGKSFQTVLNFNGIMPFFDDNGSYDKTTLKTYLTENKTSYPLSGDSTALSSQTDLYLFGKKASNIANLIRIAEKLGETETKTYFISLLKTAITDWLTYTGGDTSKYFYYNSNVNSLIGYLSTDTYGLKNLNDHHFQYGYLVYAAAILAFYDSDFKTNYGDMVKCLIRDYATYDRADALFPFLRNFSPYEGHSWANGFGYSTNGFLGEGPDQESSSEAMNAWAGIYMWGLLNGDDNYKNLGIFGYATENSAVQNYWENIDKDIYPAGYTKTMIGILFGNKVVYGTWFGGFAEYVYGIQMLPLNPSSMYLAYNSQYVSDNYYSFKASNNNSDANRWYDVFWQYESLFEPATVLAKYNFSTGCDSTTKSFLYYWLNTMNQFGKLDTTVYANTSSYAVFNKNGTQKYCAFNPTDAAKTVAFKNRTGGALIGSYSVPAKSMVALNLEDLDTTYFKDNTDKTITLSDGTQIIISSGTFNETASVSINTKISADTDVNAANQKITNASSKDFAVNYGVFREFVAYNLLNQKITQFNKNMIIKIPYNDANGDRIIDGTYVPVSNLRVVYLDETSGEWVQLANSTIDYTNKNISASISHLSVYGLIKINSLKDLSSVIIYPNPCYMQTNKKIKIDNLPTDTSILDIYIYDISGKLMKKFTKADVTVDYIGNYINWDGMTDKGNKAASGVYLVFMKTETGKRKEKIALIW